jgi:hypothetical protein
VTNWDFRFDRAAAPLLRLLGVSSANSGVRIADGVFHVRFGPWRLRTPTANIAGAVVTGPYHWVRVVGPHLSLADRGVTFGTNAERGVCVRFDAPVPALLPVRALRHPAVTLTVDDPEALAASLNAP